MSSFLAVVVDVGGACYVLTPKKWLRGALKEAAAATVGVNDKPLMDLDARAP